MNEEQGRAIAKFDVVARPLPMVMITPVGMVLDAPITFDQWATGLGIGKGVRAFAWAAGDWLLYGEQAFPDRYEQGMNATGLSLGYLRNLVSLCSRVKRHVRNPNLSIRHHQAITSFDEEWQTKLLNTARIWTSTVTRFEH